MKIKKGDMVVVIAGKDRGKSGMVIRAFPRKDMVLIEGVNIVKKHQKAKRQGQAGQIVTKPLPLHVSNVAFKDPKTGKATRIGYRITNGKKERVAQKSSVKIA